MCNCLSRRHLPAAVHRGTDLEARSAMSAASIMALLAIYLAKGGAAHTIGEPMGTIWDLPHGYACGIALPAMMEYLLPVRGEELAEIYGLSGDRDELKKAKDPSRAAVESSIPVIWNAPSPTRTSGRKARSAACTPTAAGTPNPIEV